jgi:hypothetical protein
MAAISMTATIRPLAALPLLIGVLACPASAAVAASCGETADAVGDFIAVVAECTEPGSVTGTGASDVSQSEAPAFVEYRWVSVCRGVLASSPSATETDCRAAQVCPVAAERLYRLWGRTDDPPAWLPLGTRCFGETPTAADTPRPTVTPGLVLNEIRRIGLPTLAAKTQPEGKTLVNFATIFYTEANPFATKVTLLGQNVDIEATPSQYTWHYGDGSSSITTSPGSPYPSKDITYSYSDAHITVRPRVDVTYTARFRVNGGAWQNIDETVTVTGPEGSLRVSEAAPVLSGDYS